MAQGYEGMFNEDKRMFSFEDQGDYVQLKSNEYPGSLNIQSLAQGQEGVFTEDKRMFPFEDQGDYVQLKSSEYPGSTNIQTLAQGYEGMFNEDKRVFPEFEDKGDYWNVEMKKKRVDSDLDSHLQKQVVSNDQWCKHSHQPCSH